MITINAPNIEDPGYGRLMLLVARGRDDPRDFSASPAGHADHAPPPETSEHHHLECEQTRRGMPKGSKTAMRPEDSKIPAVAPSLPIGGKG